MAFCSSCGAQLEGGSRFCVKCGADQAAKAGSTPVAAAAPQPPPPQAAVPPHQAQPFAGVPPQYPPPPTGQPFAGMPPQYPPSQTPMPVIMGAPPAAPAGNKTAVYVVLAAAILYGFYYIGTHDQNQNQGTAPAGQTQPAPPGPGGNNQAIVAQQQFLNPSYNAVNGYIQVSQAQWMNGSNVALAAAGLGCEQLDANGQGLAQNQATLTGPAQPGQTVAVPTFQLGAVVQGAAKVNCTITAVTPAN